MYASVMTDLIGVDVPPDRSIELARDAGFAGVDLRIAGHAAFIESFGAGRLADAMRAAGLRAGYCSLLPMRTSVDDADWAAAAANLPRLAAIARKLGFTRTSTVVLPFHPTLSFEANLDTHVRRLRAAAPILRDHGLGLGLEYVSPLTRRAGQPNPFVFNLAGMLELLAAVDEPNVGLMLDTFHWHCADESFRDLAKLEAKQVVVVHVNDAVAFRPIEEQLITERELPGDTGVIDLRSFMAALRAIGYDGPLSAEPTNPRWKTMDPLDVCRRTARSVQRLCDMARAST